MALRPVPLLDPRALAGAGRPDALCGAPDGRRVVISVARPTARWSEALVHDLWLVDLGLGDPHGDPGAPHRLTHGDTDDRAPAFLPNGDLLFLSKRPHVGGGASGAGEPTDQVWRLPRAGGEAQQVTRAPLGVTAFCTAREAPRIFCMERCWPATPRADWARAKAAGVSSALHYRQSPVRFWDHWLGPGGAHPVIYDLQNDDLQNDDLQNHAARALGVPGATPWHDHLEAQWDLSCSGRWLALTRTRFRETGDRLPDVSLEIWDLDGDLDAPTRIIEDAPGLALAQPRWLPGEDALVCTRSDRRGGAGLAGLRPVLWRFTREGQGRALLPDWDVWPDPVGVLPDGGLLCAAREGARERLYLVDETGARTVRAEGSLGALQCWGDRVLGLWSQLHRPPTPVMLSVTGQRSVLSPDLTGLFPTSPAHRGVHIEDRTAPGDPPIQYFLVRPEGPGPFPTLLWVHGGPVSHWSDGWNWRWNPLPFAAAGYAVVLPNPRGSQGFGQAFIDANYADAIYGNCWGLGCASDVLRALDHALEDPALDGARQAAMGGSFGGYMVNWLATGAGPARADRFRAIVSHAGIASVSGFYGVTDMPAWWARHMGGVPHGDPVAYDRYAPLAHVGGWSAPTLIVHGDQDHRVPVTEALTLFEALQHHGVLSELVVYPDENHWIRRPGNVEDWYRRILDFLDKHV